MAGGSGRTAPTVKASKVIHPSKKEVRRDTAPPRRWLEQPWLWFAAIVVVVLGSLGVSFAAGSDPEDIAPVSDTAAFCAAVQTYRERTAQLNIGLDVPGQDIARIRSEFTGVQLAAPPEIKATVDDLAARNLDASVSGMLEIQKRPDSLDRVRESEELLRSVETKTRRSSDRYEKFVRRACGIELTQPAPPTSTTAPPTVPPTTPRSAPTSVPQGVPSVPIGQPDPTMSDSSIPASTSPTSSTNA